MLFPWLSLGLFVLHFSTFAFVTSSPRVIKYGEDCSTYAIEMTCPPGFHFSEEKQYCDTIEAAKCSTKNKRSVSKTDNSTNTLEAEDNDDSSANKSETKDTNVVNKCKRTVCYFSLTFRNYEDVYFEKCTHIVLSNAMFVENEIRFSKNPDSEDLSFLKDIVAKKKSNPNLKVMLSIGGDPMGSKPFEDIVNDFSITNDFIMKTSVFLRKHNLDGISIDWRYPVKDSKSDQKYKRSHSELIGNLKKGYGVEKMFTGKPMLLVSVLLHGLKDVREHSYDVKELNRYVDFFSVYAINFVSHTSAKTGHHSPLRPIKPGHEDNVEFTANYFATKGASKDKMVIMLPLFANMFTITMTKTSCNAYDGVDVIGVPKSTVTKLLGRMAYFEYCALLRKPGVPKSFIQNQQIPYLVNGDVWVGYDDQKSITRRVNMALSNQYGGVGIWQAEYDDAIGKCGDGQFPMMTAIYNACTAT